MSDIAMIIKKVKGMGSMAPSVDELRRKAKVACAFRLIEAVQEEDADAVLMALEDLDRIEDAEEEELEGEQE